MVKTKQHIDKIAVKNFGTQLNELLKKLKIRKKYFAKAIGYHPNIISAWTNGKVQPTLTTIYEIIKFFNKEYPDSEPMKTLFPDLIEPELQMYRANCTKEYNNKVKELKNKYERAIDKSNVEEYIKLKKKCDKLQDFFENEYKLITLILSEELPNEDVKRIMNNLYIKIKARKAIV